MIADDNGTYWLFTAEMFRAPVDANMRCAIWKSLNQTCTGHRCSGIRSWHRERTIVQSNQSFPLLSFDQQCNEDWCPWKVLPTSSCPVGIGFFALIILIIYYAGLLNDCNCHFCWCRVGRRCGENFTSIAICMRPNRSSCFTVGSAG